ncbi:hypothetical protein OY671_008655, partial [Metschnikowia pulcherrima]
MPLTVTTPFDGHEVGEVITDAAQIEVVLASDAARFVVRTIDPETPEPAPDKAPQGAVNSTSISVPDVIVQIVPPQQNYINGVATDILGIVGTASWGPVNSPTIVGSYADYQTKFGQLQARKYDAGTAVYFASLNGAQKMRIVRVTDGTDAAATVAIGSTGVTITAKYTGTTGNAISVILATGTAANSWKVTVTSPGQAPEVF